MTGVAGAPDGRADRRGGLIPSMVNSFVASECLSGGKLFCKIKLSIISLSLFSGVLKIIMLILSRTHFEKSHKARLRLGIDLFLKSIREIFRIHFSIN